LNARNHMFVVCTQHSIMITRVQSIINDGDGYTAKYALFIYFGQLAGFARKHGTKNDF
jgi:hypothetical protein